MPSKIPRVALLGMSFTMRPTKYPPLAQLKVKILVSVRVSNSIWSSTKLSLSCIDLLTVYLPTYLKFNSSKKINNPRWINLNFLPLLSFKLPRFYQSSKNLFQGLSFWSSALVSKNSFSKAESRPFITCIQGRQLGPHLPSFLYSQTAFLPKQIVTLNPSIKRGTYPIQTIFLHHFFRLLYRIPIKAVWAMLLHTLTIESLLLLHPKKDNFISVVR